MLQTDKNLSPIPRYGCYFMSIGHIAERISGKQLRPGVILRVYCEAVIGKLINVSCYVIQPGKLLELFVQNLDKKVRIETWWTPAGEMTAKKYDYLIEKWGTPFGTHFVCSDYNPDPTIPLEKILSTRYFRIKRGL